MNPRLPRRYRAIERGADLRNPAHQPGSHPSLGVLDRLAAYPEVRRVSSVSGQLDLIVEIEAPSINHLNTIRDRVATLEGVDDVTTSIILRRDIDRSVNG
jgi:DNA-binding Lrp family transcriptional regulator